MTQKLFAVLAKYDSTFRINVDDLGHTFTFVAFIDGVEWGSYHIVDTNAIGCASNPAAMVEAELDRWAESIDKQLEEAKARP